MLALLTLLGLPVLAGALLALDHYVRFEASRDELSRLAFVVRVIGLALAGTGLAVMLLAAAGAMAAPQNRFIDVTIRMGAATYGLLAILTSVVGNAFRSPGDTSTLREEMRVDQRASLFRLLCWTVALMPLIPFLPVFVMVIPLAVTTLLSSWGALNRGSQISLLWRLAIASENELPYADEVEAASPGAGRHRREGLAALASRLRNGQTLSEAVDDGSPLLPRGDILAIRATDGSPALTHTLREAAQRSVHNLTDLREGNAALPLQAYLVNVVVVLLAIIAYLMIFAVPKFKDIFNDFNIQLPALSAWLMDLSDSAGVYWFLLGPLLILPVMFLLLPPLIALAGWENLNFPLLMRWFPRRDAPEVLRIIAAIVESGRPLAPMLDEISNHHPREDLRDRLRRLAAELELGQPSWEILCRDGFIRRDEAHALDAAGEMKELAWAMRSLADAIDARQRIRTAWLLEWQRPLLIGGLGIIVAIICAAIFMPLIEVINSIQRLDP